MKNRQFKSLHGYLQIYIVSVIFLFLNGTILISAATLKEGVEFGRWTMDFDAALSLAEKKTLPILLDFTGSDWCGWCKFMDKKIFSKSDWNAYAKDKIILVKIDFPQDQTIVPAKFKKRNMDLQNHYGISGYPTYVILDSDGKKELGRLGASRDADIAKFIGEVAKIIRKSKSEISRFLKELDSEKAVIYQQHVDTKESLQQKFNKWLESKPSTNDDNLQIFFDFNEKLNDLTFQIELIEAKHHASKLEPGKAKEYLAVHEKLSKERQALNSWLQTRPENSSESTQIHNEFQNSITQLTQRLESFLND